MDPSRNEETTQLHLTKVARLEEPKKVRNVGGTVNPGGNTHGVEAQRSALNLMLSQQLLCKNLQRSCWESTRKTLRGVWCPPVPCWCLRYVH